MLKVAIAQLDSFVGAFEINVKKIAEAYSKACQVQARILLTPELSVCGYPPHDLMDRPEMYERNERALSELAALTKGKTCALAVGHVSKNPKEFGRIGQNSVTILEQGKQVFKQAKQLLPTYDVLDEARYFEPAEKTELWNCDGLRIGVAICEDLWGRNKVMGRVLYGNDPVKEYQKQKADLLLSVSASPFESNKRLIREKLHSEIARDLKIPLIYLNQVGATDEILFDGGSFALDANGNIQGRLPFFKPSFGLLAVDNKRNVHFELPEPNEREDASPEEIEILTRGLVIGIQEYYRKTGFSKAIIGLSGGIDSAVVATLAAKALGPKNILGVAMPSQYSSAHSLEDAEALAKNLGIRFEVRPIKFLFSVGLRELSQGLGELSSFTQENLQARLRGLILMSLSNQIGALVLTTGNKSELATGYCTMYGDMVGALCPLGDLLKTSVYELAQYLNKSWNSPIPQRCITKAPSAELRPDQTDQDTLPPYSLLDEILYEYFENGKSVAQIKDFLKESKQDFSVVEDVLRRVQQNEYKRRQAAPILKVSSKAFGIGRRIPISKIWD